MTIRWEAAAGSHVGRVRRGNEDSYRENSDRGIFLVADGMGGHAAGEVASAIAAETIVDLLGPAFVRSPEQIRNVLENAFQETQRRLIDCCADDHEKRGMGTTLTALHLRCDGKWVIGHIGDSRAYRLRGSTLEQLTTDHTWVQREVEHGRLSAIAAIGHHRSHILTRVLTDDGEASPDLIEGMAIPGDLYLLVTDGLFGMLDDRAIGDILLEKCTLAQRVDHLMVAANENGGIDNVTAVLIEIAEDTPTVVDRGQRPAE